MNGLKPEPKLVLLCLCTCQFASSEMQGKAMAMVLLYSAFLFGGERVSKLSKIEI